MMIVGGDNYTRGPHPRQRHHMGKSSLTTAKTARIHLCEHCTAPVVQLNGDWWHDDSSFAQCGKISTAPLTQLHGPRIAITTDAGAKAEAAAEWAWERAELLNELEDTRERLRYFVKSVDRICDGATPSLTGEEWDELDEKVREELGR